MSSDVFIKEGKERVSQDRGSKGKAGSRRSGGEQTGFGMEQGSLSIYIVQVWHCVLNVFP